MQEVQIKKSPRKSKTQKNIEYLVRGALPSRLRTTHDLICFLILFALALGFVFAFNMAAIQGKPAQFLYSTGQEFICGYGDAKQYPFAYFYNPLVNTKTVCVKQCPTGSSQNRISPVECYYNFKCRYQTQLNAESPNFAGLNQMKVIGYPTFPTVGNICLPDYSVMTNSLQPSSSSIYQKITEQHSKISVIDLYNNFYLLIASAVASLILSSVSHCLMRNVSLSKIILPSLVFTSTILFISFFFFLCQSGTIKADFLKNTGYLGLAYLQTQYRYLALSMVFLGLTILSIVVASKQIYAVKRSQIKNWDYEEYHPFRLSWKQIVIYATFVTLLLVHWGMCIFTFVYLSAAQENNGDFTKMFVQSIADQTIQKIFCVFVIFWAIFGSYIIIGMCKVISALFYSENCAIKPQKRQNRLFDYWVITLYHHIGSVAMANFFAVPASTIQFLLWSLKTQIHKKTFIDKMTCFIKWCCSGSYIQMAFRGRNYFTSSRMAYDLIWNNYEVSSIEYKNRIQSQRIALTCLKAISSLICPLVIQGAYTFNHSLHTRVFEILWILIPSWLIGYGISEIILNGIQSKTQIKLLNYKIAIETGLKKEEVSSVCHPLNRIHPEVVDNAEQKRNQ